MTFLDHCQPINTVQRVPINIDPDVRDRLVRLLFISDMRGVGYSTFINRACEIAEAEIRERHAQRDRGFGDGSAL